MLTLSIPRVRVRDSMAKEYVERWDYAFDCVHDKDIVQCIDGVDAWKPDFRVVLRDSAGGKGLAAWPVWG